jgi:hypothetical protein
MDVDKQSGHGHGTLTGHGRLDYEHSLGQGYAEWISTWICSLDMDKQHEHGHAAWTRTCSMDMNRGMRHTSTALYFYGASKKSLHKPRNTSENRLFHISYGFTYYLQLLCLQFLSKTHLNLKKSLLASK